MAKKGKPPPLDGPLTVIEWMDANTDSGWVELDKARTHAPTRCWSAGWVVRRTRKFITICGSQNEDGDVGEPTVIPRSWVIRIVETERKE